MEKLKIILIFSKDYVNMSPIVLARVLRKNLEELEMVVRDGNLFIVYKTEEQRNKA